MHLSGWQRLSLGNSPFLRAVGSDWGQLSKCAVESPGGVDLVPDSISS